ncbi:MAG: phosphatidate cytidylyltransferase [Candidatus Omnitrophica bacterium]|nr:phosphatidate cytidylyltransferase [Candidatus Omnitrophota bacterium]
MDNPGRRIITGALLIIFVSLVVYFAPSWLFCLVIAAFVCLGQFEFFKMVENRGIFVYKYFGTVVGTLIPVVIYLGSGLPDLKNLEPFLIVVASLFALTLQFARKDKAHDHLISTALTVFSLFYISWFFSFFIKLKFLENGSNLVAFLILVTKSADMGAYFIGRSFGKSELIPRISPKKTKEGTIGGIVMSLFVAIVIGPFLTGFSFMHLFILGLVLATLGQVGDLAESLIKRDCSVKDSGTYLGGIGGILDLIDSLLFTVPIFYFYVKAF